MKQPIDFLNKYIDFNSDDGLLRENAVKAMEEYAKHIIQVNFCDGSSTDFEKMTIGEFRKIHQNINNLVDWVNS